MISFSQLIQNRIEYVEAWVNDNLPEIEKGNNEFNWLGLAEFAALKAKEETDLRWAEIAIRIYECLAKKSDDRNPDKYIFSEILLRVCLISVLGIREGHPILDITPIINWFLSISEDPEEVDGLANMWRRKETRDKFIQENANLIRTLRKIRQKIYPVKILSEKGIIKPNKEMQQWILLFEKLP